MGISLDRAIDALTGSDPRLDAIVRAHGRPARWTRPPGFETLLLFILEQQVSLASAAAAYRRLEQRLGEVTPAAVLAATDDELRADGFSRQKAGYARRLAAVLADGHLDLAGLAELPDEAVRSALTALPGIGPWTADVYLLACLERPDVWPVGDRALQVAAGEAITGSGPLSPAELDQLGEAWRPHRSVAAQILWHSYLTRRGRPTATPIG
jgi:DNA-3-methyladenine glycosylase II